MSDKVENEESTIEANSGENIDNENIQDSSAQNESEITENIEELDDSMDELEKVQAELAEQKDKFVRLYSEFENFRRRSAKEKIELISNASDQMISDLLPVLDDFERAIANNEKVDDADAIKEGINLVYQKFAAILKAKGLKEIDALNQPFDVDFHEAITKIPAPSEELKNSVVDVVEKGYTINEKIIRYSKVVIGE